MREAGAPPQNQVWVQNRTGRQEMVVYKDSTYEVAAGCQAVRSRGRCSGNPLRAQLSDAKCQYGVRMVTAHAGQRRIFRNGRDFLSRRPRAARITTIDLRPVVDSKAADIAPSPEVVCQTQVNGYQRAQRAWSQCEIIGKVREQVGEPGRVVVIGAAWTVNGMLWRTRLRLAAGLRAAPVSSYAPATPSNCPLSSSLAEPSLLRQHPFPSHRRPQ